MAKGDFLEVGQITLRILQVSTTDGTGGAEKVAFNLHCAYRLRGYRTWLVVGRKYSNDADVLPLPNDSYRNPWVRGWFTLRDSCTPLEEKVYEVKSLNRLFHRLGRIGEPFRILNRWRGFEDFSFPGTRHLLDLLPERPDIIHCHNLHGGYFDLRVLPRLSRQVPVILTLHDAWLLTGHCAHSFDCERWKTGCGNCPDLTIPSAIKRDATKYNWQRKRDIYRKSRLYLATPSQWLMDKVRLSMAESATDYRVIPNGVNLSIFHPADNQHAARAELGLPQEANVLLFAANTIRDNIWKDYKTLRAAVSRLAENSKLKPPLLIALGDDSPPERVGEAQIHFVPFQQDSYTVSRYYQAADLYVHAARADTFPNTVLEALCCGTPVVATAVGGIPEQVKGLQVSFCKTGVYSPQEATGVLVPMGDATGMAEAIMTLLENEDLRQRLSKNAAKDARDRFDLNRQVEAYLSWYKELITYQFAKS